MILFLKKKKHIFEEEKNEKEKSRMTKRRKEEEDAANTSRYLTKCILEIWTNQFCIGMRSSMRTKRRAKRTTVGKYKY